MADSSLVLLADERWCERESSSQPEVSIRLWSISACRWWWEWNYGSDLAALSADPSRCVCPPGGGAGVLAITSLLHLLCAPWA